MKLVELVNYFRNGGTYEEFCQQNALNSESEVIEVYMAKPINLDSDLAFFEIENTQGKIEYSLNDREYLNLFDLYYFQDAMAESESNAAVSDYEIAKRLYEYAIKDA